MRCSCADHPPPRLVAALLQLRHHPGIELLHPHQLRPVVRQPRHTIMSGYCMFLLCCSNVWRHIGPLLCQTQRRRGFLQQILRVDLLARQISMILCSKPSASSPNADLPRDRLAVYVWLRPLETCSMLWQLLQQLIVHNSPLSPTITDAMSK